MNALIMSHMNFNACVIFFITYVCILMTVKDEEGIYIFHFCYVDTMQPHIVESLPGDNLGHLVLKSLQESHRLCHTA